MAVKNAKTVISESFHYKPPAYVFWPVMIGLAFIGILASNLLSVRANYLAQSTINADLSLISPTTMFFNKSFVVPNFPEKTLPLGMVTTQPELYQHIPPSSKYSSTTYIFPRHGGIYNAQNDIVCATSMQRLSTQKTLIKTDDILDQPLYISLLLNIDPNCIQKLPAGQYRATIAGNAVQPDGVHFSLVLDSNIFRITPNGG